MIGTIPHILLKPAVQEVFTDKTPSNVWTNRTPRRIGRTGVDGSIPISTPIHSGISETSAPSSSDSTGTRISIGTIGTSTDPPAESIQSPGAMNKRKSSTPDLRDSNKLVISIDIKFTNNLVAPTIFTDLVREKLSNNSSRAIYACVGIHLSEDITSSVAPQFVDLGFYTVDSLDILVGI